MRRDSAGSDLPMAILAVAAAEPDLPDPLRSVLEADPACIEDEMTDAGLGRVIFFALQGMRFHAPQVLPDGGTSVRNRIAQRI